MARYVEIDEADLEKLTGCLQYVITRYAATDTVMVEYLRSEMGEAMAHLESDRHGAEVASEIDLVLDLLSSPESEVEKPRRARVLDRLGLKDLFRKRDR